MKVRPILCAEQYQGRNYDKKKICIDKERANAAPSRIYGLYEKADDYCQCGGNNPLARVKSPVCLKIGFVTVSGPDDINKDDVEQPLRTQGDAKISHAVALTGDSGLDAI